jgi:NDP-sugar pyrophosphorylase family protein
MVIARQAAILVGGRGTRLGALAADVPKPLMPIDGASVFLDEALAAIVRHGYDDIILLAGHLHEQFIARYGAAKFQGASVRIVVEDGPAGTAGALAVARDLLDPVFLLANGDTLFDIELRRLDAMLAPDAVAALALRRVPDTGRYGRVEVSGQRIVGFHEKEAVGREGLINGGMALCRREILSFIGATPCSIEQDVYPRLAREGRLMGEEFAGYFIDIGLPETLAQARRELPARRRN